MHLRSLGNLERALHPGAGHLPDLVGINGARKLRHAFDHRAGRAFHGYARSGQRRTHLVGLASPQRELAGPERQLAMARRNVNIADPAQHRIGRHRKQLLDWNNLTFSAEKAGHYASVIGAKQR